MTIKVESGGATPVFISSLSPIGTHHVITLGTVAYSPQDRPSEAKSLLVQAIDKDIRFTLDSATSPTASVGFKLAAGDSALLIPITDTTHPQFFREESGSILQYLWMG